MTMLTCLCTHNAMCTLCRSVLTLRIVSGHVRNVGDKARADSLVDVAASMEEELTASYKERAQVKAQKALTFA